MSGNRVHPGTESLARNPIIQQPKPQVKSSATGDTVRPIVRQSIAMVGLNSAFTMSISNAHEFEPHPSINCLAPCDTLLVQEDYDSVFSNMSRDHKYRVFDRLGQLLFLGREESSSCCCCCLKQMRPFRMQVTDAKGEDVILLTRGCSCGVVNCAAEVRVFSPPDNLIGIVAEGFGFMHPKYYLIDATSPEVPLFEITGPMCTCSCFCDDVDFPVRETGKRNQATVGYISKKWGGIVREFFSASDAFGVTFPVHFDPKIKVLFMAACFLIVSTVPVLAIFHFLCQKECPNPCFCCFFSGIQRNFFTPKKPLL